MDLASDTNLTTGLPASQHDDASDLGTSAPHLWTQESGPAPALAAWESREIRFWFAKWLTTDK